MILLQVSKNTKLQSTMFAYMKVFVVSYWSPRSHPYRIKLVLYMKGEEKEKEGRTNGENKILRSSDPQKGKDRKRHSQGTEIYSILAR